MVSGREWRKVSASAGLIQDVYSIFIVYAKVNKVENKCGILMLCCSLSLTIHPRDLGNPVLQRPTANSSRLKNVSAKICGNMSPRAKRS